MKSINNSILSNGDDLHIREASSANIKELTVRSRDYSNGDDLHIREASSANIKELTVRSRDYYNASEDERSQVGTAVGDVCYHFLSS